MNIFKQLFLLLSAAMFWQPSWSFSYWHQGDDYPEQDTYLKTTRSVRWTLESTAPPLQETVLERIIGMTTPTLRRSPYDDQDQTLKSLHPTKTTPSPPISDPKEAFVKKHRTLTRFRLQNSNDTWLMDHIPELHKNVPLRNIIISTWRSGSSFLGELVASYPGTLYFFEPFMFMQSQRIHGQQNVTKSMEMVKSLFECQFHHTEWMADIGLHLSGLISRTPLKDVCLSIPGSCADGKFISQLCNLFPIQLYKFVRLGLRDAEELLNDDRYSTRLLYLVRDPRGTMKSRNNGSRWWCDKHPDCYDAKNLCNDLVDDYAAAVELVARYPGRVRVERYETLATDTPTKAADILSFFNLTYHRRIQKFVEIHSKPGKEDEFGTYRKSKDVAFKWVDYYKDKSQELDRIQDSCGEAMALWGYMALGKNFSLIRMQTKGQRV